MKVTMLGNSGYPQYAFAPSKAYATANGKGYVSPLSGMGDDMEVAENIWKGAYPGVEPASATDPRLISIANEYGVSATDLYNRLTTSKIEKISSNLQSIIDAASKGVVSVSEAIAAIKASGEPPAQKDAAINRLQWQQYLPWIVGGAALIVGMMVIAGTTSRKRTPPRYRPGRGAYQY